MRIVHKGDHTYVIRFNPGDELIEGVKSFCRDKDIKGALLWGIGAAEELALAFYNPALKKYEEAVFNEPFEIASLLGNVAEKDGEIVVHAHGVFSDKDFKTRAGHVKRLVVSATGEIVLRILAGELLRENDPQTGLNLLE